MRIPERLRQYYRYYRILRRYGVWHPREYLGVLRHANAVRILDLLPFTPKVLLDIGAYQGQWTQGYLRILGNAATFYVIEPISNLSQHLQTIFKRHHNVHVFTLAISSETGHKEFHVAHPPNFSSFEVSKPTDGRQPSGTNFRFVETRRVPTETLDSFYKTRLEPRTIDLLKLDVQGHELQIMRHGTATLQKTRAILIEWNIVNDYCSDADFISVHQYLTAHQFVLSSIPYQYCTQGQLVYADALYVHQRWTRLMQ